VTLTQDPRSTKDERLRSSASLAAAGTLARETVAPSETRSARQALRDQIARLETELSGLFTATYPRLGFDWRVGSRGGPRVLSLAELEVIRDRLVTRVGEIQDELATRTAAEERKRRLIEELMLAPEEHKWVIVRAEDIGEPGCKSWHVRPRFGLLGMMLNWWRVCISSGCPLAS
jgi:hypothetical protein